MINFFKKFTWRGTGRLLTSAWRKIWPFIDYALESAKPLLLKAYDKAVDEQQEKLVLAYAEFGPSYMSKVFDKMQSEICDKIARVSFVPVQWRDKACSIIEDEGNRFQRKLVNTAATEGVAGLNKLIDQMQYVVKERIKAL